MCIHVFCWLRCFVQLDMTSEGSHEINWRRCWRTHLHHRSRKSHHRALLKHAIVVVPRTYASLLFTFVTISLLHFDGFICFYPFISFWWRFRRNQKLERNIVILYAVNSVQQLGEIAICSRALIIYILLVCYPTFLSSPKNRSWSETKQWPQRTDDFGHFVM